ncbi:hypothetical protein BH11PSE8_BH11PSE8_03780 [soil metagenome]
MDSATKSFPDQAANLADKAADGANEAIRTTQGATNTAFNRLSDKVDDVRSQAAPVIDRISTQAKEAARKSADALRDTTQQLRDKALNVSDQTVGYIKDEPVKAMLIAAATGAALMALVGLLGRSRDR